MNKLSVQKRAQILGCLVSGNSIRATVRITGAAKNTVVKLLAEVGKACSAYQDCVMRDLSCKHIHCDQIWSFCYAKEKNIQNDQKSQFGYGDVWTWTATCADTKLVPFWLVGNRDGDTAKTFIDDLKSRLAHRVQMTTDGHKAYLEAVEEAFGSEIDYAVLIKIYGQEKEHEKRYSPSKCVGTRLEVISGNPNSPHISASYAERGNLTIRMGTRGFTPPRNAFSKKAGNLAHSVALHFMYYNFARIHKTLRVTPAMEAGLSEHVWSLEEIVKLLE